MTTITQTTATEQRTRAIAHRTFGDRHGPITRLMSPSGPRGRSAPAFGRTNRTEGRST